MLIPCGVRTSFLQVLLSEAAACSSPARFSSRICLLPPPAAYPRVRESAPSPRFSTWPRLIHHHILSALFPKGCLDFTHISLLHSHLHFPGPSRHHSWLDVLKGVSARLPGLLPSIPGTEDLQRSQSNFLAVSIGECIWAARYPLSPVQPSLLPVLCGAAHAWPLCAPSPFSASPVAYCFWSCQLCQLS